MQVEKTVSLVNPFDSFEWESARCDFYGKMRGKGGEEAWEAEADGLHGAPSEAENSKTYVCFGQSDRSIFRLR